MNPTKKATLFYDLEVGPESFDFPMFLLLAQQWLKEGQFDRSELIILPGDKNGFRSTGNPHEIEHSNWRLRQLIAPSALAFLPEASLKICRSRQEAIDVWESISDKKTLLYPEGYNPNTPHFTFSIRNFCELERQGKNTGRFKASSQAIEYIDLWIKAKVGDKRLVAITLRQARYQSDRNSDIASWIQFANQLDKSKYYPIFVPDIEWALEQKDGIEGIPVFSEACFNLEIRLALNTRAWLNLVVNTGPASLCAQSDDIRYLHFKMITPGVDCSDLEYFEKETFLPGSQWPCAHLFQNVLWEDDTFSMIQKAFSLMEGRLENTEKWNEKRLSNKLTDALQSEDLISAKEWSACYVSFFPDSMKGWLLRAEVLLYLNHRYECLLTLINAAGRFENFSTAWLEHKFLGQLTPEQFGIQQSYAKLSADGLAWREKRFFQHLLSRNREVAVESTQCFIFGAGQGGRLAKERLPDSIKILGFIDGNPDKHGQSISGIQIQPPEFVREREYEAILIASMAAYEIFEYLCVNGFPIEKVFFLEPEWILPEETSGSKPKQ